MSDAISALSSRLPQLASGEDREKTKRIARAKDDFSFFCSYYLDRYFFCPLADYQEALIELAQRRSLTGGLYERILKSIPEDFQDTLRPMDKIEGLADVEPRGHGKTTRWTFAFPLWASIFRKASFPIIVGADKTSAVAQLTNIKTELETNEKIIADFGELRGKEWARDNILLSNGVRIKAFGKGSSMRGTKNRESRPDYVIIDDVFKDQEADSPTERKKVQNWFERTVLPLGQPGTFFVLVNTITHNDDLISTVLRKIQEGGMADWVGVRLSAEIRPGEPLWPQRYTWQWLKNMELKIGSIAYAQEYLSRALSDEDRLFQEAWICIVPDAEVPGRLAVYEGIDPATGAHDLSAVVDVGYSRETGKIYVLGSHGKKESPKKFKDRLVARYRHYRYKRAVMEGVAFQNVYRQEIIDYAMASKITMPIKGMNPGRGSKAQRNMKLSPMIENGTIVFLQGNDMLIDQLLSFPTGSYDDLVDALYYAVAAVNLKGFGVSRFSGKDAGKDLKALRKELKI